MLIGAVSMNELNYDTILRTIAIVFQKSIPYRQVSWKKHHAWVQTRQPGGPRRRQGGAD